MRTSAQLTDSLTFLLSAMGGVVVLTYFNTKVSFATFG